MSELQVRHIASVLKKNYSDKIDVSDCLTTKIEDKEALLLTRAYAAYSLQVIAGASEEAAANSISSKTAAAYKAAAVLLLLPLHCCPCLTMLV